MSFFSHVGSCSDGDEETGPDRALEIQPELIDFSHLKEFEVTKKPRKRKKKGKKDSKEAVEPVNEAKELPDAAPDDAPQPSSKTDSDSFKLLVKVVVCYWAVKISPDTFETFNRAKGPMFYHFNVSHQSHVSAVMMIQSLHSVKIYFKCVSDVS